MNTHADLGTGGRSYGLSKTWPRLFTGLGVLLLISGQLPAFSAPGVQFESNFYWVRENKGPLVLRVLRNNDLDLAPFTVRYATHDGTALVGYDYAEAQGTLSFDQGELEKSLMIQVMNDSAAEGDEEFTVTLSDPQGSALLGTNSTATVRIVEPFAANALVPEMIARVQQPELLALMRQITGEEPVLVNGDVGMFNTRLTGSPTLRRAMQFAFERFQALQLETQYQPWESATLIDWYEQQMRYSPSFRGMDWNVVGIQPGASQPEEIVVVAAHFDSVGQREDEPAPGADDNASGSAAVFMAARVLSQYQFARTLHFVLFTGEEQGLWGSTQYALDALSGRSNIVAALVPDMIAFHQGGSPSYLLGGRLTHTGVRRYDPGVPFEFVYPNDMSVASTFINVAAAYGLNSVISPVINWPGANMFGGPTSDYGSFWAADFPALCVREITKDDSPLIHSTNDTLNTLNWDYFTSVVKAITGAAAQLAEPIGRKSLDVIEVVSSDWTPGSGIGGSVLQAKHEAAGSESGPDPRDLAGGYASTNANPKCLRIFTDPYNVELQSDSRPASSESIFRAKLSVADTTGSGVTCSNRLRFSFVTPPQTNRIYLARVRLDGHYVAGASDFDCITNLQEVVAAGGFLELPALISVPDRAVYGTCDISARFLNTEPANCRLRFSRMSEANLELLATAQLGVHIIDDLEVSTNLNSGTDWVSVQSYPNYVRPDVVHFEAGWTELPREVDRSRLPAAGPLFFRLKRTWMHP